VSGNLLNQKALRGVIIHSMPTLSQFWRAGIFCASPLTITGTATEAYVVGSTFL